MIARRLEFRGTVLAGAGLAALGALGFATFDARRRTGSTLGFMALLGLGIGPALSGLQVAIQRSVAPREIAGAMGTLLLVRQVGGAVALASAERSTARAFTPGRARRRRPGAAWSSSRCWSADRRGGPRLAAARLRTGRHRFRH